MRERAMDVAQLSYVKIDGLPPGDTIDAVPVLRLGEGLSFADPQCGRASSPDVDGQAADALPRLRVAPLARCDRARGPHAGRAGRSPHRTGAHAGLDDRARSA